MKSTLFFILSFLCIGFCNAQIHNFDTQGLIYGHPNNVVTIGNSTVQVPGFVSSQGSNNISLLEITGNTGGFLRLGSTNPYSSMFFLASQNTGHKINTLPGTPLFINEILSTDRDYVTINTSVIPTDLSEVYRLVVGGKILTEGVRVELEANWADYVFAPNYTLKSLYEVEQFIKDNGHLPNVPSAATIKDEGLDMEEMMTKQMEKIEELTLYIIELKKEIDALKAQK
ncbi:hypothetical protein GCM10011344_30110 [Dokdonia pacifica]|uniref:DUF4369 domain-containing protein n=1 Tax=Dokdonia pacifica TaxID=1627892 RepID=A0A239BYE8_9FLAO|nr:hypothetical protein [Dokdonia pacifica]GGG27295.1 hypothetical protein GCM10011344_30110 [Dokdonia pacifica]SNS13075.1 hypothetical protein SAMN06265376_10730 [Dokdonia pacifica]